MSGCKNVAILKTSGLSVPEQFVSDVLSEDSIADLDKCDDAPADANDLLLQRLCLTWDYSRAERLNALGLHIEIARFKDWVGCEDTVPKRDFHLSETACPPVEHCVRKGEDTFDFLNEHSLRDDMIKSSVNETFPVHAKIPLLLTIENLCSRWDYSRPDILGSKGVFVGVSPSIWSADTTPTQSVYLFDEDIHAASQCLLAPPPSNEKAQETEIQRLGPAAPPSAARPRSQTSLAPATHVEISFVLRRLPLPPSPPPTPAQHVVVRTCTALDVVKQGHLVPELTTLSLNSTPRFPERPQWRISAAPYGNDRSEIASLSPPGRGWGMLLATAADGELEVREMVAGGAAERSGLIWPGDRLLAVAGTDVRGHGLRAVAALLAAAAGDSVCLTVHRRAPRLYCF